MFQPLEKKRYSDHVVELIKAKIMQENLKIGTRLPSEVDLSQEFNVSRAVIREALRILEISGLVNIKKGPSGGIFVSNVYHKPIKDSLSNMILSGELTTDHLFSARLLIEPHIAREAARHATHYDLKALQKLMEDSEAHIDDPVRLRRNNIDFHLLLARASGTPVFTLLLESIFELMVERFLDFWDLEFEQYFFKVHKNIFKMIKARKPEEAGRLTKEDMLDLRRQVKAHRRKK
jgi:DNA-binding FadR family transcriptional regulator